VRRRDSNLPLAVGLVLSVILHAAVIVPILMAAFTSHGPTSRMQPARFNPEDFRPPEEEAETPLPEVELGIDAPTPSTLTWIGYEEYRKHLAALAEFEQAAFTDEPAGGGPPEGALAQTPEPQEPEEERPEDEAEQAPPPASVATLSEGDLTAIAHWLEGLALSTGPPPEEPAEIEPQAEPIDPIAQLLERVQQAKDAEQSPAPKPAEEQPAPRQPEQADRPQPPGEPGIAEAGDEADKESDATSTIDVALEEIQLGRPIARPGLEVKPQRPTFTTLTLLTASPGNPLVEIRFGADGRPANASILEGSGDSRVDHAIEASLYRWRASGKALSDLKADQTVDVRIRIVLNPSAVKKPDGR
jgi:hypothetical protein